MTKQHSSLWYTRVYESTPPETKTITGGDVRPTKKSIENSSDCVHKFMMLA